MGNTTTKKGSPRKKASPRGKAKPSPKDTLAAAVSDGTGSLQVAVNGKVNMGGFESAGVHVGLSVPISDFSDKAINKAYSEALAWVEEKAMAELQELRDEATED